MAYMDYGYYTLCIPAFLNLRKYCSTRYINKYIDFCNTRKSVFITSTTKKQ